MSVRKTTEWLLTCPDPEGVEEFLLGLNFFNFAIETVESGTFLRIYTDDESLFEELRLRFGCVPINKKLTQERDWFVYLRLKPFEIVPNVWIDPTHRFKKDAIVIKMKPSAAFGTGDHPTTKLVARLMYDHLKSKDRVLDVGCGTGILAIIAKKLNAKKVVAVDNDPLAVEIAKEFARKNRVQIDIKISDLLENVSGTFDLVVANLTTNLIVSLLEQVGRVTKSGSIIIVSGIPTVDGETVKLAAKGKNLHILEEAELEGWKAFCLKKP
ncbi:50S ribosomal protein L11 methyltransferase [Pseudothermotoga sp.]